MSYEIKIAHFLKKYKMHYSDFDFEECCNDFIKEMENGLSGKESSLLMLPTYLTINENVPINTPVIVMDAGGTNFRIALVTFDENKKAIIEDFKVFPMPGTSAAGKDVVTAEDFFDKVADELLYIIDKSNSIGFCFSYPTEILPDKDGITVKFSKEIDIKGLIGLKIGDGIKKALKKKGVTEEKKIILLNDTVATMVGGITANSKRTFSDYIGFILGTGTNTCYVEKTKNISKIDDTGLPETMGINVESGSFANLKRGYIDIEFDNTTNNKGDMPFEKMISGAYLGSLIYTVVKYAISDGILSSAFAEQFKTINDISMRNIDDFCFYPDGDNILASFVRNNEDDRLILYHIIDAIFERTAQLVTVNIASILIKTGSGIDPMRPVCVVAEGTTFYKSKLLRPKLDYYVRTYINDDLKRYCEFLKLEHATLIGTAVAALLN